MVEKKDKILKHSVHRIRVNYRTCALCVIYIFKKEKTKKKKETTFESMHSETICGSYEPNISVGGVLRTSCWEVSCSLHSVAQI